MRRRKRRRRRRRRTDANRTHGVPRDGDLHRDRRAIHLALDDPGRHPAPPLLTRTRPGFVLVLFLVPSPLLIVLILPLLCIGRDREMARGEVDRISRVRAGRPRNRESDMDRLVERVREAEFERVGPTGSQGFLVESRGVVDGATDRGARGATHARGGAGCDRGQAGPDGGRGATVEFDRGEVVGRDELDLEARRG